MVKEFWMKAQVFDEVSARMEEEELVRKDPKLKGKSREEMGLNKFTGTVIKSVLAGLKIIISRAHLAKLLGVEDYGKRIADYKSDIYYRQSIKKEL
ncbi:60S ribosomal protein L24, partial [Trifolium medium]|nr:60S ribosomal protein L24 [Trifolium medium]